jgi:hypothetical protein
MELCKTIVLHDGSAALLVGLSNAVGCTVVDDRGFVPSYTKKAGRTMIRGPVASTLYQAHQNRDYAISSSS